MKKFVWMTAGALSLAMVMTLTAIALWPSKAEAGPVVSTFQSFRVTCTDTAQAVIPSGWNLPVHTTRCFPSKTTPDDSAECACIGGPDVSTDKTDGACTPIGGCAQAEDTAITVDGKIWCADEGATDVVLQCMIGYGIP